MELEQDHGFFSVFHHPTRAPVAGSFGGGRYAQRLEELLQNVAGEFYETLDVVSSRRSWRPRSNETVGGIEKAVVRILEELRAEGSVGHYWVRNVRYNDAPSFYALDIWPRYATGATDGRPWRKPTGHGFGKSRDIVFAKALGEFLERHPLTLYKQSRLVRGSVHSFGASGKSVMDLTDWAGFSEEQKKWSPRLRFGEDSVFAWEKAFRISQGEPLYVPAQLVYWNYWNDGEPYLGERNTNGCGGMFTKEGALLSGLYELVQRDAFLRVWFARTTPKNIRPESIPHDGLQELVSEGRRYGFESFFLDVTGDIGIPAFIAVVSDPSGRGPRFSIGGGCQAHPAQALYRALEEAWSVYYWMRPQPPYRLTSDYRPFRDPVGQEERLRLWANPEMEEHFSFLLQGERVRFSDLAFDFPAAYRSENEELERAVAQIERNGKGYEVYAHLASWSPLAHLGYASARVIVPSLVRLYLDEQNSPLGALRLGRRENRLPHPFP